jgi:glycosyltransferase involved in cell wall biosynthesis
LEFGKQKIKAGRFNRTFRLMKILQVIDTLKIGGAERISVMLSNLLFKNNIEVAILILVEDGDLVGELNPKIPIFRLNRKRRFDIQKMKEFAKIINDFDIIHTHLKHNFRYTRIVSNRFGKNKSKIIFHDHSHTFLANKLTVKYYKDLLLKNIIRPHYYIGVSEENCDWGNQYLGVKKEHCYLLENTIEEVQIENKEVFRSGIVMVSNISPIKNIEFALNLLEEVEESLTIYGRVIYVDYFEQLKEIINEKGLQDRVVFIHNCTNIQQELPAYKFALHTSLKETGPLVLIEYLAQKVPFLSYQTGQVYQMIGKELPMFFIDTFNQLDWISKIKDLSLVKASKMEEVYTENFNSETYLKKCLNIYQKIENS